MANEDKRTWAEIDLGRLYHNYREVRRVLPEGCRFAGLCKANAYGHGAVTIAKRLEEIGADYIAVSCYEEAAELRSAGMKMPILLLAPSPAFLAPDIARLDVQQAIGDIDCARGMSRALAGTGLTLRCHIKLETGMGRTGFAVESEREMAGVRELLTLPGLEPTGVFTHFAVSDEPEESFTLEQFARFTKAVDELENETGRTMSRQVSLKFTTAPLLAQCLMPRLRPVSFSSASTAAVKRPNCSSVKLSSGSSETAKCVKTPADSRPGSRSSSRTPSSSRPLETEKPVRPMPVSSFMWQRSVRPVPARARLMPRAQSISPIACSAPSRAMSGARKAGLGARMSMGISSPAARSSAASS